MKDARTYYRDVRPDAFLELHLCDGTIRGVAFRDHDAKAAALAEGRAELDRAAIRLGLLPYGADFVTRALAADGAAVLEELRDPDCTGVPRSVAMIRVSSSLEGVANRSEHVDEQRDAGVRRTDPAAARRYDLAVGALENADATDDA